jgi:hypothetical protein
MWPISTIRHIRAAAAWLVLATFLGGMAVSGRAAAVSRDFLRPVSGKVTLHFAARYHDDAAGKTRTHYGIDITAAAGSTVVAADDGKVSFAGQTPLGLCVSILHANGVKTTYLPLGHMGVSKGDAVSKGLAIGTAAAAGDLSSSSPHLHLGAIFAGEYIDPEALLAGDYKADLTKLIRRGDIPPGGSLSAMTSAGKISSWPVISIIARFLNGSADLVTRFWDFLGKTGLFLGKQANFLFQTGQKLFKNGFGRFGGLAGTRWLKALPGTTLAGFRRPVSVGTGNVVVFDPSGDSDEPESRLYVYQNDSQPAPTVEIYDGNAALVRRLDGCDQIEGGLYWSGDDAGGRIVEPGLYCIVLKSVDGGARIILAEVQWHL